MDEQWVDIPGYEDIYKICKVGNRALVVSKKKNKLLNYISSSGTVSYTLSKEGKHECIYEGTLLKMCGL